MTTLEKKLEQLRGSKILTIKTRTIVDLLKKSRTTGEICPYQIVERICERNGIIGVNYENAVNNQRKREEIEEEFKAESLWNGKGYHVSPYLVGHIEKPEERYLAFMAKNVDNLPLVMNDIWYADGKEIDPSELKDFLKQTGDSKRQQTEKKIIWRTINVKNVIGVKCGTQLAYA